MTSAIKTFKTFHSQSEVHRRLAVPDLDVPLSRLIRKDAEPISKGQSFCWIVPEQTQGNGRDPVAKSHHEAEAENLVKRAFELWGMQSDPTSLEKLLKGDSRKVLVAVLVRKNTSVGNRWLAERLAMGHTAGVSRHVSGFLKDRENQKKLEELETMLMLQ